MDIFSLTSPCLKGVIAPLATAIRNNVSVACTNKYTDKFILKNRQTAHDDLFQVS